MQSRSRSVSFAELERAELTKFKALLPHFEREAKLHSGDAEAGPARAIDVVKLINMLDQREAKLLGEMLYKYAVYDHTVPIANYPHLQEDPLDVPGCIGHCNE